MKRIISASYRNDTPAFESESFFRSLEQGYKDIHAKFGDMRISLLPENVFCFVFWTKNPSDHFLQNMHRIKSPFYFQWTLTPYGKDIETNLPEKSVLLERFKTLSKTIGKKRVFWRYDPILMSAKHTVDWHVRQFERFCNELDGYTERCVISFMDEYGKISDEVKAGIMRAPTNDEVMQIAAAFSRIAGQHGITIQTCSEMGYDLSAYGIHEAPCIDADFIEREFHLSLPQNIKHPGSFRKCLCAVNTDIGQYHTCKHGCKYCYAK